MLVETPTLAVCGAIGFADFGADGIERRQQQHRKIQELARHGLHRAEHRVRGSVAAGERDADPTQDRRQNHEENSDFRKTEGQRVGHSRENENVSQRENEKRDQQRAPHLLERLREDLR